MKKKKGKDSRGNESVKYLDCTKWSPEWEELLEEAYTSYPRLGIQTIHMVLPIPGKRGTLVFHDTNQWYHSTFHTLTTLLRKQESSTFYNYYLTSNVLKQIKGFQKRLLPMINAKFVLFPLASPKNSIWLNPLSMNKVREESERTFIKMATGPGLVVHTSKQAIDKYAANALLSLTCSKRDMSWVTGISPDMHPLDYLELPDTPFIDQLSHRHQDILQDFPITYGEFSQHYSLHYALAQLLEKNPFITFDDLSF
ncbi:hypothetical protein [Candidatus Enterococcus ferrettii]|uniref:Uncharacterized protein n=1 Tax=Candidatus Enterococcus ferrettii TaxID=2815324 RepID=A0ABV0ER43_9ENTE|nr:hypothetical protein [Enterococcus sp. 665A]MBO1343047.1 hypothetical protein [Enterococcus sp. 665A]